MIALALSLAYLGSLAFAGFVLWLRRPWFLSRLIDAETRIRSHEEQIGQYRRTVDALGQKATPAIEWVETQKLANGLRGGARG